MSSCLRIVTVVLALLFAGTAQAQNVGWLGVDTRDVTKAESDQLGWDAPRGAKVINIPTPGSPADKAGIRNGDIILAIDRSVIDYSSDVENYLAGKQAGAELRLQILSGRRERRVNATLAERPGQQQVGARVVDNNEVPYLMLDTGGHMAVVKGIAFTPDGSQLVTASEDKQVRVWDWRTGKTLRIIR